MNAETPELEDELTLADLWELIRPVVKPALLIAVLVGALAYFLSARSPKVYEAEATLLIVEAPSTRGTLDATDLVPPLDPEAYQAVAKSETILKTIGLDPEEGEDRVRTRLEKGKRSSVLRLLVKDHDPGLAAERANAWAKALLEWDRARTQEHLRRSKAAIEARIAVLDREIAEALEKGDEARLRALERIKADLLKELDWIQALLVAAEAKTSLEVLELATPPTEPVAPRPKLIAALAVLLTLFLILFAVLLRQALDPKVRSSEEAARLTGLPVLTEFPKVPPGIGRELSKEAANFLRVNVDRALIGESPKIVVITSPEESEGKSSVSLALARAYARAERPVLLIDADLRRPILDEELKVKGDGGLTQYLSDPFAEIKPHRLDEHLAFIPAGDPPEDPSGLLTEGWKPFIQRVTEEGNYEVIVIDSAPVLPVADTLIIVPHASGTILVVAEGRTWKRRLLAAQELLKRVGAKILGVAVTHVRQGIFWSTAYRYGYRYGYGRYGQKREEAKA